MAKVGVTNMESYIRGVTHIHTYDVVTKQKALQQIRSTGN